MKYLVVFVLALSLGGCFRSESQSKTTYQGTVGDRPLFVECVTATSTQSGVDIAKVVETAIGAATGDLKKVLDGIKPPEPRGYGTEIGAGATAAAMALLAYLQKRRGDEHKADADEGWKRALEKEPTDG